MRNTLRAFLRFVLFATPQRLVKILWKISGESLGLNWNGGLSSEIRDVTRLLEKRRESELVVLDVGANFGKWTESFLENLPNSKIYAFEPSKKTFEILSSQLSMDSRVSLVHKGAGKTSGEARLFSDTTTSGMASLTKRDLGHIGLSFEVTELVSVITLNEWCVENKVSSIDVLKLDVEGHELDALEGLGNLISEVYLIQFEFGGTSVDARKYFKDYWEFLTQRSFKIFRATPHGTMEIHGYTEELEQFVFSTYYAVKRS
jgi:FkbM family methyltransferase